MAPQPARAYYADPMATPLDILVIEDDPSINEAVCAHLERLGHRCTAAFSGTEGLLRLDEAARSAPFSLVITDLMLPGAPGENVVEAIRRNDADLPVIVISARITPADKTMLLRLGADDYLTKPFDLDELTARIEVQMRHRASRPRRPDAPGATRAENADAQYGSAPDEMLGGPARSALLTFRAWELDSEGRTFRVNGAEVALTRTEFNILELLMGRPSKVFTKQELFELAWGEPYSVEDSTVNVYVSNLRRKLKPTGTDGYLQTVWGLGYKLQK